MITSFESLNPNDLKRKKEKRNESTITLYHKKNPTYEIAFSNFPIRPNSREIRKNVKMKDGQENQDNYFSHYEGFFTLEEKEWIQKNEWKSSYNLVTLGSSTFG